MHNYSADAEPSIQRFYFERIHLSIKKPSLKLYLIIIEQCVGDLSSSAQIRT